VAAATLAPLPETVKLLVPFSAHLLIIVYNIGGFGLLTAQFPAGIAYLCSDCAIIMTGECAGLVHSS
jgi:hypothetical protein